MTDSKRHSVSHDLAERWLGEDGDLSSDEITMLARAYLSLVEQLEAVQRWFRTEPWKGDPDPSSFGGLDYIANERAIGYGTYRDPRFLPDLLREVSSPANSSEKRPCPRCGNREWTYLGGNARNDDETYCNACDPASSPVSAPVAKHLTPSEPGQGSRSGGASSGDERNSPASTQSDRGDGCADCDPASEPEKVQPWNRSDWPERSGL